MKISLLVSIGLSVAPLSVGVFQASASDHIVKGTVVQAGDPVALSTVFLAMKKTSGYEFCTGSIIDQDIVVTAAHCVDGVSPDSIQVMFTLDVTMSFLLGTPTSTSGPDSVHPVYGAVADPQYSTSGIDRHDIAIIRFKGLMPDGYQAATLLGDSAPLNSGEAVVLAGYGSTNPVLSSSVGQLRKADVSVDQMLGQTEVVLNEKNGAAACWGDSGGPAFVQLDSSSLLLWGLTNRPYPDANPTCIGESVYTRITRYSDFIASAEASLRELE
jgi:hypothetical protein